MSSNLILNEIQMIGKNEEIQFTLPVKIHICTVDDLSEADI